MRYNGLKNIEEDSNEPKRKRINSIIENNNSQNEECSFLDNININELQNFEKYQRNESDLERNESSDIIIDNDDNANNDELEIKKENSNETSGERQEREKEQKLERDRQEKEKQQKLERERQEKERLQKMERERQERKSLIYFLFCLSQLILHIYFWLYQKLFLHLRKYFPLNLDMNLILFLVKI